jgi:negative regulator of sigma E activity
MSAQSDINERLSALLDGELLGAELDQLLEELESSPELNARWQRLCTVQAVRKGVKLAPKVDIAAGVMSAIADAPAPARDPRVVALPQRPARRLRREWVPAVSLAAAASLVAVVAVTSIRGQLSGTNGQTVALTPAISGIQPVAVLSNATRLNDDAARQLDNLMIEHANYRGGGMGGPLGYARVAAHTADYQIVDGQH